MLDAPGLDVPGQDAQQQSAHLSSLARILGEAPEAYHPSAGSRNSSPESASLLEEHASKHADSKHADRHTDKEAQEPLSLLSLSSQPLSQDS